ncbi:unnamed protein product [Owenia fusiformis]|uniref:Uncharacterized protein n=1 Tax=Owenia fusiformis TaxID=6347 RepID=A0A8J1UCK7_OWEFU|nr:unnamed protein product [Owenia fusiformis]
MAKLKYSQAELDNHEHYIRNRIVKALCKRLAMLSSLLAVSDILPNGSSYQGTKIDTPCEYDYILPMDMSKNNKDVVFTRIPYRSYALDVNIYGDTFTEITQLFSKLTHLDSELFRDHTLNSRTFVRCILLQALDKCLSELHAEGELVYKGLVLLDSKLEKESPKFNEVYLHSQEHGPSIQLRVGGPLCVTDIDMGFCLKVPGETLTQDTFYIALLSPPFLTHWIVSIYRTPNISNMDACHRYIIMALKYILTKLDKQRAFNSFSLTTLVRYHIENECDGSAVEQSIGKCFNDVCHSIARLQYVSKSDSPTELVSWGHWLEDLMNKDCPGIKIFRRGSYDNSEPVFPLVIYILNKLAKSSSGVPTVQDIQTQIDMVVKTCKLEAWRQHIIITLLRKNQLSSSEQEDILSTEDVYDLRVKYNHKNDTLFGTGIVVINTQRIMDIIGHQYESAPPNKDNLFVIHDHPNTGFQNFQTSSIKFLP